MTDTARSGVPALPDDAPPGWSNPAERQTWPALARGFARRCPSCGKGHLFDGYLKVVSACPSCGEDLTHQRADDGPAYLTILVVGHLVVVAMHVLWAHFRPEPLVLATLLTVLAVGLSLWLLPRFKGAIVGFQWARRMHGFGGPDADARAD